MYFFEKITFLKRFEDLVNKQQHFDKQQTF